ncbi:protein TASOR isoform X2 [Myripristis murdjan]|uniref:protein TASOR isoform X2 n=1 Tax=Myripristis murdjan TaxID=586833 RepID=UPI001175DEBC|nr:protein TASOR-like isoform X2 [Myripristis murdjan]
MDGGGSPARREAARPRQSSVADVGGQQNGELTSTELHAAREAQAPGPDRPRAAGRVTERRSSASVHQRHMPMEPLRFHIPRKTKEKLALFQYVSTESREYEDMMTILTSSYRDTSSAGTFTYSKPRLVHSELLEKEFVEKRKEMKADGRTDKELEESHCFLLVDAGKTALICEKGLLVGHNWITALGNPTKGVYLSKYSDLLQVNAFTPGATGEIIIFKVMKGKVKSIYDNTSKNLLDPTPRFDSHLSKNVSKVTSLTSYRAFELTQQYFYEYSFDELRQRPRQVCPYAVISFQFKGKDAPLPTKPMAPLRLNSQLSEGGKERAQFTVWTGDLVKDDKFLLQISLRSFSPPFLPCRLPEKLEVRWLMRLDHVTSLLCPTMFSWNLYAGSHEVVKNGQCCSLLEVIERTRSETGMTKLLQELETKRLVLVTPLCDRGFLFLLSSVQMATPPERGEGWKRCLQALFIFPETRDVAKSTLRSTSSSHDAAKQSLSGSVVVPRLSQFLPALHHALVKARANPPTDLSAGVEQQAREYLSGLKDGKVRHYPMGEYDSKLDERGKLFPAPKHHRVNMDSYLSSYLYSPHLYLLSVARVRQMVEAHCDPEELQENEGRPQKSRMEQREERSGIAEANMHKRNAEKEARKEGQDPRGQKRKLEQEMAETKLKYLRRVFHVAEDGNRLPGLNQAALGTANQSLPEEQEEGQSESWPFDRLATKLGLPTNCDIDLRKQEELEEQTAGSVSSLEGFSPSSHSGDSAPQGPAVREGGSLKRRAGDEEDDVEEGGEIPWVLIPITGLSSERYTQRERDLPQDPRFLHAATATGVATTTSLPRRSPALSPDPSPPPSPSQCPSPEPHEFSPINEDHSLVNEERLAPAVPWESAGVIKNKEEKPQTTEEEKEKEEPVLPSHSPAPERKGLSPQPTEKQEEAAEEEEGEVIEVENEQVKEGKETKLDEEAENKQEPKADERKEEEAVEEMEGVDDNKPKEEVKKLTERQPSLRDVDSIVKEHLADFSSEMQHLLQEESVHYSFPQCPRPASNTQTSVCTYMLPQAPLTPFSQYVSFYNPCPPVQDYVTSLKDGISSVLTDSQSNWPHHQAPGSLTDANDQLLANTISAFVASIRAGNTHGSRDCGVSASCGEPAGASTVSSVGKTPLSSRGGDLWLPNSVSQQCPCDTNSRSPSVPSSHVPLSVATSASFCPSSYNPSSRKLEGSPLPGSVHLPASNQSPQPPWLPQQPHSLEIKRTVSHEASPLRQAQDNSSNRPVYCSTSGEGGTRRLAGPDCEVTLPGFTGVRHSAEPTDPLEVGPSPHESISCSASVSAPGFSTGPALPAPALSSLISNLQPEVFSSLVEIIKDVKRNSLQFYFHRTEQEDQVYDEVREYLLRQGNVEQSPVAFLEQENSKNRLLVIIQNKDIARHIHKIPGLVSLKRLHTVMFVGIDSLEDIRNNTYNELFVSGGYIVSDEFVLSPDFITHDHLAALLMFLEQQSSPESMWRWRVHCKTQKKLKEQARFKRDAASLLDVLSAYQKRLIVEFLPYHRCDMMNHQSPDLDCLIELQARHTQHRHTIFLTASERHSEMFPNRSSNGIIVASIHDITHNFTCLVGYHGVKDKHPNANDLLSPKGLGNRRLSHEASALGSELSPSSFTEHNLPFSSDPPPHQHLHQQPFPGLIQLSPLSDQLVPKSVTPPSSSSSSSNEVSQHHSGPDFEALRMAISHLRAERQAQQQQQRFDPRADFSINPLQSFLPNPALPGALAERNQLPAGGRTTPPVEQGGPGQQIQLTPGRKAVTATLDSIHLTLEAEQEEEQTEGREGADLPVEGLGCGGSTGRELGDQNDVAPPRGMGLLSRASEAAPSANPNAELASAASSDGADPGNSTGDREKADQRGQPAFPAMAPEATVPCSSTTGHAGGEKARDRQPGQEQPTEGEAAPPRNQDCRNTNGNAVVTEQDDGQPPALPRLQQLQRQIQQHQLQLQQQNQQQHQSQQQKLPPGNQQQLLHQSKHQNLQHQPQPGGGLLPHPANLTLLPNQPFPPMLGSLAALGGVRGLLGPAAVWPGGLGPPGATLVWGFPQAGREFPGASLLGEYPAPGGQGSSRYRGGQRGGFNGM